MMNPDMDCYTKDLHNRKILRKTQKKQPTENQMNFKLRGAQFLHLAYQVGRFTPVASR